MSPLPDRRTRRPPNRWLLLIVLSTLTVARAAIGTVQHLATTITESVPCRDAPHTASRATAAGEPGGIRVELSHRRRSCRAEFVATASLDATDPRRPVVHLELREHEDPPYSGCLCFPDVTIRIRGLAPGLYRLEAPAMDLHADVTVRAGQ